MPAPLSRAREKLLARLGSRRTREREGLVLVEGPRAIGVALEAGVRIRFVLVADGLPPDPSEPLSRTLAAIRAAGIEELVIPADDLARHADTQTPQGILAVVEEPAATMDDLRPPPPGAGSAPALLLVLDRIQDPGNAGTLIRAAAAFGAAGVVALDGTVDPWNPKVVRSSAGEAFRLPVVRESWEVFDAWRRRHGVPLHVADAGGVDVRTLGAGLRVAGPAEPVASDAAPAAIEALLIGNEGAGPRPEALASADTLLALPLAAGVESLNAAMAGSILLWALGPGGSRSGAPPS
ncbi:MAG: RNA methyltransferase [Gemmatimonadales bacterium]|nr:MAG: RNA methyltransferase [Gemmatimonadales bacterium]